MTFVVVIRLVVDRDGFHVARISSELAELQILSDELACKPEEIVDFDLQVCDTQLSIIGGALKEFVFSGRLDNLCSSFCSLKVLWDHNTCYLNCCQNLFCFLY